MQDTGSLHKVVPGTIFRVVKAAKKLRWGLGGIMNEGLHG